MLRIALLLDVLAQSPLAAQGLRGDHNLWLRILSVIGPGTEEKAGRPKVDRHIQQWRPTRRGFQGGRRKGVQKSLRDVGAFVLSLRGW